MYLFFAAKKRKRKDSSLPKLPSWQHHAFKTSAYTSSPTHTHDVEEKAKKGIPKRNPGCTREQKGKARETCQPVNQFVPVKK